MALWILGHTLNAAWWLWVLRGGGAKWLEGSFLSGLVVHWLAPRWTEDGIRLFALLMLVVGGAAFVVGLLFPG